ncbi:DNA polymerase IV [Treponema sp. OMZ 840]
MSASNFFHVDLDAFFASVEQLDNPEYRGKPVIVGSLPTDRRGVVSTCSYEARQYGVHSAMPIGKAFQLCPSGIFLRGRMKRYHEKSREVMTVLNEFSPEVRQMSVDEAFMDMGGTERLFGTAEEAAKKLKQAVRERTGLTLSIGAASNKYVAKIASGMSKPDGLYIVENGKEEDFMLSLPLKKIWGVGEKTLERLTKAGFRTSRDVHKASLNLLQSLFGTCTGSFLYHAVRGCEVETFENQTKSRSISSEHTFSFDLTDLYTIDTALLELAWEVMYRLLTEGWISKTLHIKIRYEDFTTVSIQETSDRIFSSADDLYNRAKLLFRKKYENGRGIRLLGLGAQNLEDGATPVQSELFDFGEKKKAAVEKAVIRIQKKNPGICVEKARLLHAKEELQPNKTPAQNIKPKHMLAVFCMLTALFFSGKSSLAAQKQNTENPEAQQEALSVPFLPQMPVAVFSLTPDSPDVEFYAQGSWEAKLHMQHTIGTYAEDGKKTTPVFSFAPPVFIQKTDITLWFFLQKKWYFEAAVTDAYEKSTVAAGYYGDGFLRHVRIGNRGIVFPQIYGISTAGRSAGGAADQAPGVSARWQSDVWQADALLRYDMLDNFEKTWAGTDEIGEKKIGLHEWQQGLRFVLPPGTSKHIASIYVQSDTGTYEDNQKYTYRQLSPSDYLILNTSDTVILAKPAAGRILAEFYIEKNEIVNTLGSFAAPHASGGSFLHDIQAWFGSAQNPKDYSYPLASGATEPDNFFTEIGTKSGGQKKDALILQYPPFFSPFADASLYVLNSDVRNTDIRVLSQSGIEQENYGAVIADYNSYGGGFEGSDFFKEQRRYARLFNRSAQNMQPNILKAAQRYPAAPEHPFLYLSPQSPEAQNADKKPGFISVQTVSVSGFLDIGTAAVPGSVVMYRNGIKETGFRYDNKTGLVHPLNPPLPFDKIRITWQEHKEGAQTGRLSAAAGIRRQFGPDLSLDASASFLWPLTQNNTFSTGTAALPGSLNTALKIDWQKKDFSLENTSALSFEIPDTGGVRRILGMDGSKPKKILLGAHADAGFPESVIPALKKRPAMPGSYVQLSGNAVPLSATALRETDMEGYALRMEWNLPAANAWAARTIDFKGAAASLASAREFSIWLKMEPSIPPTNYEVYLQLGASENQLTDSQVPLPTWRITEDNAAEGDIKNHFNSDVGDWQKVTVYLRDEDRMQLAKSQNARLIIRSTAAGAVGTLTVGACEIRSAEFGFSVPEGCLLRSSEQSSPVSAAPEPAEMLRFNPRGANTVQFFKWDIPAAPPPADKTVRAYRYIETVPLASYDDIVFFICTSEAPVKTRLSISLESETPEGTQSALILHIEGAGMTEIDTQFHGLWKKAVFNMHSRTLSVGGVSLNASDFTVETCNTQLAPNRIEFAFSSSDITDTASGALFIDEVYVSGKDVRLNAENIFAFNWSKEGTVFSVKNFPLAANPAFTAKIRSHVQSGNLTHKNKHADIGTYTDGRIQADIAGIKTALAASFSFSNRSQNKANHSVYYLQNASYSLKTTPVFFVTRIVNASSEYSFTPTTFNANKAESLFFDFSELHVPLSFSFKAEGNTNAHSFKQSLSMSGKYALEKQKISYTLQTAAQAAQQGKMAFPAHSDFFSSWLDVSKVQFSGGKSDADKRTLDFSLNQSFVFFEKRFEPEISLNAHNVYTGSVKTENTASDILSINLPFTIEKQRFSVEWIKKSSSVTEQARGGSYTADVFEYGHTMNKRQWLYTALPVYDFFDTKLPAKMRQSGVPVSGYESLWNLTWKRPLFMSPLDIIVPARCSFSAARTIGASPADTSDVLQFKTSCFFSAFNCFGKFGSIRLFDWYEQDETLASLSLTYKTDKNNVRNYRIGISGYGQFMLFFTERDSVRFYTEYSADTSGGWHTRFETLWNRQGKTSIVKDAFIFLLPKFAERIQKAEGIRRQSSFSAAFGSKNARFSQTYNLNHSMEFNLSERIKAAVYAGTELSFANALFSIKNTAGISAKIQF